jgi:hypothetical protein
LAQQRQLNLRVQLRRLGVAPMIIAARGRLIAYM